METATIEFKGIKLIVNGSYTEGEEQIMHEADGGGYEGSGSDFDIEQVYVYDSDVDIIELFSFADLDEISDLVILKIEE